MKESTFTYAPSLGEVERNCIFIPQFQMMYVCSDAHEVCMYVRTCVRMCAYAPRPFCLYSQSHCALAHGLGRSEPAQTGAAVHSNTVWYTYVHTHANQPLFG